MDNLVRFVAVGCKRNINNYDEYIENIYNSLQCHNMMKNILAEPSSSKKYTLDSRTGGSIISYQIMYSNVICGISDNWYIDFVFYANRRNLQLQVSIVSRTYRISVQEEYLLKLEKLIEECINLDWENLVWVEDKYSDMLNNMLMPELHKTESIVRRMVFEVMRREYGAQWWKEYEQGFFGNHVALTADSVPENEGGEYAVPDEYLISMNITDFYKVIDAEWGEYFSKYFSEEFLECVHEMAAAYVRVMNNRRCDRKFYEKSRTAFEIVRKEAAPVLWKLEHTN